jgi:hypothetical protein
MTREVVVEVGMDDMRELAKWARKASRAERFAKLQVARAIYGERRLRCRLLGCTNLGDPEPCARCGGRGRGPEKAPRAV